MARASVEAVQEGRSQQAERINACFLTAGRDSVSCFQGRRPFLKFCFPQINAAGSARGLRVPGDCEGAGESLPRPLRQAPSPVAAPPPQRATSLGLHTSGRAAHSHPRQSLAGTRLGIISASTDWGGGASVCPPMG